MRDGATQVVRGPGWSKGSALAGLEEANSHADRTPQVPLGEALGTFGLIGLLSFGGPAGQIAMMHKVLVEKKRWLDERTFLLALNFCTLLPGPEAMQLATYSGWRLLGIRGGLIAGTLFVLPGAIVIATLSLLYAVYGAMPSVAAAFLGIKAAVLAIVIEALLRIARRSLQDRTEWLIAAVAFVAIYFFKAPFPLIVLVAGIIGFMRVSEARIQEAIAHPRSPRVPLGQTLRTFATWLAVWIVPLLAVGWVFGKDHVLAKLALFFSMLAAVTFGGAYAVLAYMAQDAVQIYGWLSPGEMLDGLGLAETTPGPLILVTEFVGFIAAYRHGGGNPVLYGLVGAFVTLWATFAPSFLWIFTGAPYIGQIAGLPRLAGALSAVTAAVVGVILNLSVWFALHVIFGEVPEVTAGPLRFSAPDFASIDWTAAALAVMAGIALFKLRLGMVATLSMCAALSLAAAFLSGSV